MDILQLDSLTQSLAITVADQGFPEVLCWGPKLSNKSPSGAGPEFMLLEPQRATGPMYRSPTNHFAGPRGRVWIIPGDRPGKLKLSAGMLRSVFFVFAVANALKHGVYPVANIATGVSRRARRFGQHLVITFLLHLCTDMSCYALPRLQGKSPISEEKGIKGKHIGTGRNTLAKNYGTVGYTFEPCRVHASTATTYEIRFGS
jgi:hypothetical protein